MIKIFFSFLSLSILGGCTKPKHKFNEDYVLIEFAAKLEGQYHTPKTKGVDEQNNYHHNEHGTRKEDPGLIQDDPV